MRGKFILLTAGVLTLILGTITAAVGYRAQYTRAHPRAGCKITYHQTFTPADGGQPSLDAVTVRYQKVDGSWKQVSSYYNETGSIGRVKTVYGLPGRGVFQVDEANKQLRFLGAQPEVWPVFAENEWRNSPNFHREEVVLGYKTLVERISEKGGAGYTEFYIAPRLKGTNLKTVFASGGGDVNKIEAVQIEIGEPTAEEFGTLPDYPLTYDSYGKGIQAAESTGNQKMSEEMRQTLQKQKVNKP